RDSAGISPTSLHRSVSAPTVAPRPAECISVRTVVVAALLAVATCSLSASPTGATTSMTRAKEAFVVVDTGVRVAHGRIQVGTNVDGYQALGLAGGELVRTGDTVCQIIGVGLDPDRCVAGASSSWSYFRAKAGSSHWRAVSSSPAATQVRHGDVEGGATSRRSRRGSTPTRL